MLRTLLKSRNLIRTMSTSKVNLNLAAATTSTPEITKPLYQFQNSLPKLPVPELEATLKKYIKTVKPLVSEEQYQNTLKVVEKFQNEVGPELQKRLQARASNESILNWLDAWWNDIAYFSYRDPVVIYVSYFYVYNMLPSQIKNTTRGAEIIQAALQFKDLVVSEELEPEKDRKGPLCMSTYKYMFNATRIPAEGSDYVETFDMEKNQHVIVARKNKFFKLELNNKNGQRLSTKEIDYQLSQIIELAGDKADPNPIGLLTTQNRDIWLDARNKLLQHSKKNSESLNAVESASFLLCLDETSPANKDEASRACWHGDGKNRFFDKSLQFIVFENGVAGFNGEHSRMDGTPTCRLNDYVNTVLTKKQVNHGTSFNKEGLLPPTELKFELNNDIQTIIKESEVAFNNLINKHDLKVVKSSYGKNSIKKFKVSPDAYAQMVIQLAFYLLHGKFGPTYESATTRRFHSGRTEVCRTVSEDSVAFCKGMVNDQLSLKQKHELVLKAIQSHVAYISDAVEGKGVDRHLLGLKLSVNKDEPVPELFKDPSYTFTSHWNLSTSQLSSEHFDGYGWGEVVPDGYGIAYMIKKDAIQFNVTAIKPVNNTNDGYITPDVNAMADSLHKSLELIRAVFAASEKAKL
ncbi:acyltransferase ChoActase/COT/CPT [Neoconidiobolus thromboides FSU 785]|nr:acyltransferase ChoActase/COT/CPT [Neoconidiobolus thromboides FSU 785]